jgi:hypothetical protein
LPNVFSPITSARTLILERARDDLRRARGALVHEHRDRIGRLVAVVGGAELLALILGAALRVHDESIREPHVRDLHRLVEQSARVVAQVEHEAADRRVLALLGEILEHVGEVVDGVLLERADPHVRVARLEKPPGHRLDLHHVAADRELLGRVEALAEDLDLDLAALLAAHQLHRLEQRHVLGAAARLGPVLGYVGRADRDDAVARVHAGVERGACPRSAPPPR